MIPAIIGSIGLSVLIAWFLVEPHLIPEINEVGDTREDKTPLLDQRDRLVQMIKDLDLDLATGKITVEDHQAMRGSLIAELSPIVQKLKEDPQ